jgi:hypothetical protein
VVLPVWSVVVECIRYPRPPEDGSHLPKHVGVNLQYINKSNWLLDASVGHSVQPSRLTDSCTLYTKFSIYPHIIDLEKYCKIKTR